MTPFSPPRHRKRAPRANLRGTVSTTLQLENRRKVSARLHQLSITGGLLEISTFLDERTKVNLTIPFASGTAYPKAEMLFPMRGAFGYLQPFRFTNVSGEDLLLLDREISAFLKQSLTPPTGLRGLAFRPPRFNRDHF
jgi:hypothetical protein